MKSHRCPACKQKFQRKERGRTPTFCSRACRQKAYRKRAANPPLRLLMNDLQAIRDRKNRQQAAIKVLEDLGYIVHLERGRPIKPKPKTPRLVPVDPAGN